MRWDYPSKTRTYYAWRSMRSRCLSKSNESFSRYGGRGISICEKWINDYNAFYEDMGDCPENLTLERIDFNGNYEPNNCKWATVKEQNNNRGSNRIIEFNNESMNLSQWANKLGIGRDTLFRRLNIYNLPLEIALTPGKLHTWNHGTRHGYEQGCRCDDCKACHAERHRRLRAIRRDKFLKEKYGE